MWEYEYSAETTVAPEALWRCWSDVESWPEWNEGLDEIEIDGPFEVGTSFTMMLPGGDTVRMRLVELEPGELFTDEMDGGDFTVVTEHRLEPAGEGWTRVVYRTEIIGDAADTVGPEIGPKITADFPDVVAALIKTAQALG